MTASTTKAPRPYNEIAIAEELDATALNQAHHGNALRVAKDYPVVNDADRAVLDRFATGLQRTTDHVRLQDIANRLRASFKSAPAKASEPCGCA